MGIIRKIIWAIEELKDQERIEKEQQREKNKNTASEVLPEDQVDGFMDYWGDDWKSYGCSKNDVEKYSSEKKAYEALCEKWAESGKTDMWGRSDRNVQFCYSMINKFDDIKDKYFREKADYNIAEIGDFCFDMAADLYDKIKDSIRWREETCTDFDNELSEAKDWEDVYDFANRHTKQPLDERKVGTSSGNYISKEDFWDIRSLVEHKKDEKYKYEKAYNQADRDLDDAKKEYYDANYPSWIERCQEYLDSAQDNINTARNCDYGGDCSDLQERHDDLSGRLNNERTK